MAKVRRKKTDVGALADRQPMQANLGALGDLPTLAQSIEIKEMNKQKMEPMQAKTTPFQPGISAQRPVAMKQMEAKTTPFEPGIPSQSKSVKVSKKQAPSGANIYDERIGGYGTAMRDKQGMWQETGEEAVSRIRKAKVKKKR